MTEAIKEAADIISDFVDDNECCFDHHGYCQQHGWMEKSECINSRAKKWLAKYQSTPTS